MRRLFTSRFTVPTAAALLLITHFLLAVGSKRHESTTSDELPHLTAGFAYWQFNDYRLQPENGVLPQRWLALPTYLQGAKFPTLDQIYWRTSEVWVLGHEFFYETGEDHFPRLMAARAMTALFSVGTGLVVFLWSRRLFGAGAALFSVTLFAFSPLFLAHGALATSDVCMAFFFLASLGLWWRHLHRMTIGTGIASAVVFGLACVAKFSAVLLLPMMAIIAAAPILAAAPVTLGARQISSRRGKLAIVVGSAVLHGVIGVGVIWAFYGFRYSAFNPALPAAQQFIRSWDLIRPNLGFQAKIVDALAALHALPEAFLYGYSYVIDSAQARAAFLNGAFSMNGWPQFFPWTFLLKSTIPVLLATAMLVWLAAQRWVSHPVRLRRDLYRTWPLVVLLVVYWAASVATHLNIGQRHIMPTYPVIFILAGAIVTLGSRMFKGAAVVALVLGAWQAAAAISVAPHFLAYFNPIAGGPSQGYRHLVDSSLDWGQDLPGLKTWLDHNVDDRTAVFLSYFGTGEPDYYRIRAKRLMMINGFKLPPRFSHMTAGVYCISTTCLSQVYNSARGPWTAVHEKRYQELRRLEPVFIECDENPARRIEWERHFAHGELDRIQNEYECLRFARLCFYLRAREPIAQIGWSINVYSLSPAEVAAVVDGDLQTWSRAVTAAVESRPRH